MSSPVSSVMIRMSSSRMSIRIGVPAQRMPIPMWCSRLPWRTVSFPSRSTRSLRTRNCSLMRMPCRVGVARGRAAQAAAGVRRPIARCGRGDLALGAVFDDNRGDHDSSHRHRQLPPFSGC